MSQNLVLLNFWNPIIHCKSFFLFFSVFLYHFEFIYNHGHKYVTDLNKRRTIWICDCGVISLIIVYQIVPQRVSSSRPHQTVELNSNTLNWIDYTLVFLTYVESPKFNYQKKPPTINESKNGTLVKYWHYCGTIKSK